MALSGGININALNPQLEETNILAFEKSETIVGFLMDICVDDLKSLQKFYETSKKNSEQMRMQNTMRIRQNDKYLDTLDQEIARLENRWVVPITKIYNIFESAIQFSDTPPRDVQAPGNSGVEITDSKKSDIQSKRKWVEEPAVTQLRSVGVKPYREAMNKIRKLRHRRSQYKYLEVYFLNLGRQFINSGLNIDIIIALVEKIIEIRQLGVDIRSNTFGAIVKSIMIGSDLESAIDKIKSFKASSLIQSTTAADSNVAGFGNTTQPGNDAVNAKNTVIDESNANRINTGGDVPIRTVNAPAFGPGGVNTSQSQSSPRNS